MRKIQVCVPSKVMIVGEYAVLEGEPCLSTCIPPALFVHLEDSNNEKYQIESKDWYENKSFDYFELQKVAQKYYFYKIFYNAIKEYQIGPVKMTIDSKIPSYAGFGSSSALRLGINLACSLFNKLSYAEKPTTKETWTAAKSAFLDQKFLQSNASGYDIITQLHGGVIVTSPLQEAWPGKINKLSVNENRVRNFLHIYLGGKGSQTKKVLNDTHQWLKDCGEYKSFLTYSSCLVAKISHILSTESYCSQSLGELFSLNQKHRKILARSPHFPHLLAGKLNGIEGLDKKWTYKTTGAGGEDAVLVFGKKEELEEVNTVFENLGWRKEEYTIDNKGVHYSASYEGIQDEKALLC